MATKDPKRKRSLKTHAPDNPEQSRKFTEAAKKRGVDQDSKVFEDAYRALTGRNRKGGTG